ncbi:DUF2062 domain-containing protein [Horticoccus luteus]|uniref:DUF2062 domain-containing protein n=1 Tax=Horticoccus luteus TaxID=2862869 RepID=A0A8F9TX02_9BACT|nr:DUF2062 domain-containing protein [Horticoccus luteus]QYM79587.1 DUF2062 domain-containing protein [Horticoccus luteus]
MTPPAAEPKRSLWQRRVLDPIVAQLTQGITPEKIALTLAVGSACALFPILGTTTILCFLVALVLRLNQPIVQLINQALWPVHVPVIYLCVRLGERVFAVPHVPFRIRHMQEMLWHHPGVFFHQFGMTAVHAVIAWAMLAPFYILLVYALSLPLTRSIYRIKHAAAVESAQAPEHPVP